MKASQPNNSSATPPFAPSRGGAGRSWLVIATALLLTLGIGVWIARSHPNGSVAAFFGRLHAVSALDILLGLLAIHAGLVLRAVRWAMLMPPEHRPSARSLIAPQFAGFAAVALFGRVADLARPYLVARRSNTPVALQIAVYSVERMLDLAATAMLFSITLLFVPRDAPHHEAFSRAGVLASAATAFLLIFAVVLRSYGQRLAALLRTGLQRLAPRLGEALANRILELQIGFATVRSATQLALAFGWSMVIWVGIALSYLWTAHSLTAVPQLVSLSLPAILLLMATSMGASLLQLPVVGWLTQIAALAAAFHGFFGVPTAAASLCALLTFFVNTLSVIPPGLILARHSGISLREARRASTAEPAAP